MTGIDDKELIEQLNAFMRVIPKLWTWDELLNLYDSQDNYVEYRGSESNLLTFDINVLEKDIEDGKTYLNVSVNISDLREGIVKGSTYRPVGNNFIWYKDGTIDMVFLDKID